MPAFLTDPVKNFKPELYPQGDVTQFFGESKHLYKNVCTPSGCLTGGHNGWDIVRPWGTEIFCVEAGKIVEALINDNGYGKHYKILTPSGNEWVYGHLSRMDVTLGQQVTAGQRIGLMGNTGFVVSGATPYWKDNPYAGTHLHLGKRKVELWVSGSYNVQYQTGDRVTVLDHDNGFLGSVPIKPEEFVGYVGSTKPMYRFLNDLEYGMKKNPDVEMLQEILKYEGLMPPTIPTTGGYFEETRKAVLAYQKRYGLITPYQEWTYRGKYCYQITRAHLNSRYG